MRSTTEVFQGDDSCQYANDGICQDGRTSTDEVYSSFVIVSEGVWAHLCGFLNDFSDCGPATIPTISAASFSTAPTPPRPRPPPPNPFPPPPPDTFDGCRTGADACSFATYCSDGGLNSLANGNDPETGAATFYCRLGSQCGAALCAPRTDEETLCADSCRDSVSGRVRWTGASRNGVCEDGGAYTDDRRESLPRWSEIAHDNSSFYAYRAGATAGMLDLTPYGYDDGAYRTFEECAEICATLNGGSLCRYFVHFSGTLGHCTNPDDGTLEFCDDNCLEANTGEGPLKAQCRYYSSYTGHTVATETLASELHCAYNTARHGFVTDSTQGALPLIPSNYLELDGSSTVSYGSAATLLYIDGLHGILQSSTNAQRTTFQQCAETCMTVPNKECQYFILLTPSDGTSAQCGPAGSASKSEPNGACLLYGGDGNPSGQTVTQTITESLNALDVAGTWDNVMNVVCNPGQYRHVRMDTNSYGTYPVDSNGITYGAVGGCGFGAPRCKSNHAPENGRARVP